MAKSKQNYQIPALSLSALNQILSRIGLRLDALEGVDQNTVRHGGEIIRTGDGSTPGAVAVVRQILTEDAVKTIAVEESGQLFEREAFNVVNPLFLEGRGIDITLNIEEGTLTFAVKELLQAGHGLTLTDIPESDAQTIALKRQAAITDATASHTITDPADAPADADALRDDLVTNVIPSAESKLNALGGKINAILAALRAAEVIQ